MALAVAPLSVALIAVGSVGRQFHCLLVRTGASSAMHVELYADELDLTHARLEKLLCNVPQLQPGEWIGFRIGATHPGNILDAVTYSGGLPLVAKCSGGPSFLRVRLDLSGLLILSALVWLVVLGRWLFRTRRDRVRIEQGLCSACGYDRRASAGPCPECGADAIPTLVELPGRPAA